MKLKTIRVFTWIVLVSLAWYGAALGKDLVISSDMQFDYAVKLFEANDFETAGVEFKRFIHFFPDSDQVDLAKFNIGVCLFHLKKFRQAAREFNNIIIQDKKDDLTREAVFYQSDAFMNMNNTRYAEIVLQNYLKLVDDTETRDRIYFNLLQIYLADAKKAKPGSLDRAKDALSKISVYSAGKYSTKQYADLIFKAQHLSKKDPGTAGFLAVIPGGGFFYCERYQDALMTFLLNAGLMVAAYRAYENDNMALAGVIGIVETGFYTGNIYGSVTSAHKHNQARLINLLNRRFSISPEFNPKTNRLGISFNHTF